MTIKEILDEIREESSDNGKIAILGKYKDNELLKRVMYLAKSRRIKFGIKQIPDYVKDSFEINMPLAQALDTLEESFVKQKIRGTNATLILQSLLNSVTVDDAFVIERIIGKDLKIGLGTTGINKVIGKDFIEKTPYQGAKSYSEKLARAILAEGPAKSDIKMDGRYNNVVITDGMILESRGGEPVYLAGAKFLEELEEISNHFDGIVLNGELTMDNVPRYASNGIIASCISITKKSNEGKDVSKELDKLITKHNISFEDALKNIRYTVWDVITVDEYLVKKSVRPYDDRLIDMRGILEICKPTMVSEVEFEIVTTFKEAFDHFKMALDRGEEGTILKSLTAGWKDSKPNWQVKMKLEMEVELEIVDFQYGKVGTKNEHVVSSLIVKSACGLLNTRTANMKEDEMADITERQADLKGKIITGKCSGLSQKSTGEWALLHPVFICHRTDKDVADTLEQMQAIEHMIKELS